MHNCCCSLCNSSKNDAIVCTCCITTVILLSVLFPLQMAFQVFIEMGLMETFHIAPRPFINFFRALELNYGVGTCEDSGLCVCVRVCARTCM